MRHPRSIARAAILALGCTCVLAAMLMERAQRLMSGQEVRLAAELVGGLPVDPARAQVRFDLLAPPAPGSNPDKVPHPEGPDGWIVSGWIALQPGPDGLARVVRAQDVRFRPGPSEILVRGVYSPAQVTGGAVQTYRLDLSTAAQLHLPRGTLARINDGPLVLVLRVAEDGTVQVAGLEQDGQVLLRETVL